MENDGIIHRMYGSTIEFPSPQKYDVKNATNRPDS